MGVPEVTGVNGPDDVIALVLRRLPCSRCWRTRENSESIGPKSRPTEWIRKLFTRPRSFPMMPGAELSSDTATLCDAAAKLSDVYHFRQLLVPQAHRTLTPRTFHLRHTFSTQMLT